MIWALVAIMAFCVAVGLLWPIWINTKRVQGRDSKALLIYEDQLAELERDQERGLISEDEVRAAQIEIKRRILNMGDNDVLVETSTGKRGIILAAIIVPLAAFGLYSQIGAPNIPAAPFAERSAELEGAAEFQELITKLRSRLQSDPNGGETRGWTLLASTLLGRNKPGEAAKIFGQLTERSDATSSTFSQYAEALIIAERGVVTPLASRAIARAVELDPTNPAATYYSALEMDQAGDTAAARTLLLDRIAQEGQPAEWMPAFLSRINQMGEALGLPPVELPAFDAPKGPSQEDVEAASDMSSEDRQAFIRTMVDGLEERLQDEPDNLDGWVQLARSLLVLGENERAMRALQGAAPLVAGLPENDQRRRLVEDGLARLQGAD